MSNLQEQIMQVVKTSLPAVQAEAVRDFFQQNKMDRDELEKTKIELNDLRHEFKELTQSETELLKRVAKEQTLKEYANRLAKRETDVLAREVKADVNDAKLQAEKEKVSLMERIMNTVFRNERVRTTVMGNTHQVTRDASGYLEHHDAPHEKTETTEKE